MITVEQKQKQQRKLVDEVRTALGKIARTEAMNGGLFGCFLTFRQNCTVDADPICMACKEMSKLSADLMAMTKKGGTS